MVARIAARTGMQIVQTVTKQAVKTTAQVTQGLATRTSSGLVSSVKGSLPEIGNGLKNAAQQGKNLAVQVSKDFAQEAMTDLANTASGRDVKTRPSAGGGAYVAVKSNVLAHMQQSGALNVFKAASKSQTSTAQPSPTSNDNG